MARVWMGLELIRQLDDQYVLAAHPVFHRCRRLPPPYPPPRPPAPAPRSQGKAITLGMRMNARASQSLLEYERIIDQLEHCLMRLKQIMQVIIIHLAALPVFHFGTLLQALGSPPAQRPPAAGSSDSYKVPRKMLMMIDLI